MKYLVTTQTRDTKFYLVKVTCMNKGSDTTCIQLLPLKSLLIYLSLNFVNPLLVGMKPFLLKLKVIAINLVYLLKLLRS